MADKITSGLYFIHKFNRLDSSLRGMGLYCEELFAKGKTGSVLRRLAKENPGLLEKIAIIPAKLVIDGENVSKIYALYMPIERIESKQDTAQSSPSCTEIYPGPFEYGGEHPFKKDGGGPHPFKKY